MAKVNYGNFFNGLIHTFEEKFGNENIQPQGVNFNLNFRDSIFSKFEFLDAFKVDTKSLMQIVIDFSKSKKIPLEISGDLTFANLKIENKNYFVFPTIVYYLSESDGKSFFENFSINFFTIKIKFVFIPIRQ
jgi:hypothetical protein